MHFMCQERSSFIFYSINLHFFKVPFIISSPKSVASKRLYALAETLFPRKQEVAEGEAARNLFGRLAFKLRGTSA